MKLLALFGVLLYSSCLNASNSLASFYEDTTIFVKRFQWQISIPQGFVPTRAVQSKASHERGAKLVEKGTGVTVDDMSTVLFKFSNGFTSIEALHQPLDLSKKTYLGVKKEVMDIMYQTFVSQMQNTNIDSSLTHETIDGLKFVVLVFTAYRNERHLFTAKMYSRMFGKTEFGVNIIYDKPELGMQLLNTFKRSTFVNKRPAAN